MSPWRATSIYTDGIIDLVARHQRPPGLPSGFQGGIALTDGTIHHQDIGGHSGYSAPFRSTDSLLCPGTLPFSRMRLRLTAVRFGLTRWGPGLACPRGGSFPSG
jgi:hypothetical protein